MKRTASYTIAEEFFLFNDTHYKEIDEVSHLRSRVYEFLDGAAVVSKNTVSPFNPDMTKVNKTIDALKAGVEEDAKTSAPFWLSIGDHPDPADLIACRNGLLNPTTRELLPHTPQLFNVNALPFDYDPAAECPLWLNFLDQLWSDDQQAKDALQEIFGLMLTSNTGLQKIFLLLGPLRSGKGTIGRILTATLGRNNTVNPTLASLATNFGPQALIDRRVAIITDARLGNKANTSTVVERLLSISGEDDQTIDRKYRDPWTGRLATRFIILTNELPRIFDASGALASRFVVLTLRNSFYGKEDHALTSKLLLELPGILNWALIGSDWLRHRGRFEMPESSNATIRQFEDLSSPVRAFVRDWCVMRPDLWITKKRLYPAWRAWCDEQGMRASSEAVFGRDLFSALPQLATSKRNEVRGYGGICLTERGAEQFANAEQESACAPAADRGSPKVGVCVLENQAKGQDRDRRFQYTFCCGTRGRTG